jgi:hypothetical protein
MHALMRQSAEGGDAMAIEFRDVIRPRVLAPLVVLLLAAGLAACNFPAGSDCSADDLPPVINMVPSLGAWADSLSPMLTWDYEGSCKPDAYEVRLTSDEGDQSGTVDGLSEGWTPPTPLAPATVYFWQVTPVSGSTEGESAWAEFRTGPVCEVGDPSAYPAPVLTGPANGAIVDTTTWVSMGPDDRAITPLVELSWEGTSGCLMPGRYEMKVSRSPSFNPSGNVSTGWTSKTHERYFFPPGVEWHDCERFYWKVTPLLGGDDVGPSSDIWSFIVNTSGVVCPAELTAELPIGPGISVPLTGHGAIAGHVWHDECAVPYESTDVAPPGCVIMPDGGIEANGVLDPGESGIGGVTVRLGAGACPRTGGWTFTTEAEGQYGFYNLTAGTYCIEIDAAADGNDSVLIPGNWTIPYRWYGPGPISVEVTLGSDDDISRLNDFAWDYQFLPASTPFARVLTDARCRLGPGTNYPILTYLSQGFSFPIIGRLEQGGWWQLRAADIRVPCWIGENVVKPYGDLTNVPFAIPPAEPTVTPTEQPPSGCSCWIGGQQCVYTAQCPAQCTPCP